VLGYDILGEAIVHGAHVRDGYDFTFSQEDSLLTIKRKHDILCEVSCLHGVEEAIQAIETVLLKQGARA